MQVLSKHNFHEISRRKGSSRRSSDGFASQAVSRNSCSPGRHAGLTSPSQDGPFQTSRNFPSMSSDQTVPRSPEKRTAARSTG